MRRASLALACLFALGGTACGGLVVFVDDDGAAAGATSEGGAQSSPGPGPGPGAGPGPGSGGSGGTTNDSTSTGTPGDLCDQYCAVWGNCEGVACELYCNKYISEDCAAQGTAYFGCLAASPNNGCPSWDDVCLDESESFLACNGPLPACHEQNCNNDGNNCNCGGSCDGGTSILQVCSIGSGDNQCDCYLDDNYIGSCQYTGECSIEDGCCQVLVGGFNQAQK